MGSRFIRNRVIRDTVRSLRGATVMSAGTNEDPGHFDDAGWQTPVPPAQDRAMLSWRSSSVAMASIIGDIIARHAVHRGHATNDP